MPTSGTALYTYIGGPNPVDRNGNVGTFSGGSFNVNFVTRAITIGTPLLLSANGFTYTMGTCNSCSYFAANSPNFAGAITGTCTGGACSTGAPANGLVTGMFVGQGAQGLATTGHVSSTPNPSGIFFAAGFKR
jgi:hypothetical protein